MKDFIQELNSSTDIYPLADGAIMIPIYQINDLDVDKMGNEQVLEGIKNLVVDIMFNSDMGDGNEVYLKLMKKLGQFPELKKEQKVGNKYSIILKYLIWFTLPLRTDKEAAEILKNDLLLGLKSKVDVYEMIYQRLYLYNDDISGGLQRQLMLSALRENSEKLGSKGIDIEGSNIDQGPYIKNWLLDYDRFAIKVDVRGEVEEITYINQSPNVRKLDKVERDILLKILKIYDSLRYGAVIPSPYIQLYSVDEKGERVVIRDERLSPRKEVEPEEIKRPIEEVIDIYTKRGKSSESPINIQNLQGGEELGKVENLLGVFFKRFLTGNFVNMVMGKKDFLQKSGGKDFRSLRNNFYHAINNGQKEEALGALLALAENGQIRAAFGDDERFVKFWGGYLEKNTPLSPIYIGDTSPKLGEEDVVARFENDPAGAKFLAMFFKYILEQRLKLSAEQAVMMGVIVSNLARRAGELEYQEMAYGDMETQKFRWNF